MLPDKLRECDKFSRSILMIFFFQEKLDDDIQMLKSSLCNLLGAINLQHRKRHRPMRSSFSSLKITVFIPKVKGCRLLKKKKSPVICQMVGSMACLHPFASLEKRVHAAAAARISFAPGHQSCTSNRR